MANQLQTIMDYHHALQVGYQILLTCLHFLLEAHDSFLRSLLHLQWSQWSVELVVCVVLLVTKVVEYLLLACSWPYLLVLKAVQAASQILLLDHQRPHQWFPGHQRDSDSRILPSLPSFFPMMSLSSLVDHLDFLHTLVLDFLGPRNLVFHFHSSTPWRSHHASASSFYLICIDHWRRQVLLVWQDHTSHSYQPRACHFPTLDSTAIYQVSDHPRKD